MPGLHAIEAFGDPSALKRYLETQHDTHAVLEACSRWVHTAYWQYKDATPIVLAGELVLPWAMSRADGAANDTRNTLLRSLKPLSYNIGSFLWTGWAESEIDLSPEAVKCGYDAAQRHWKIVSELAEAFDATPVEVSRAHWLLGAHELVAGNIDAARAQFVAAETRAKEVGETADAALNAAYAALAERLLHPEAGSDRFDRAMHALRAVDRGEDFVTQVTTAATVFSAELRRN